MHQLIDLPDPEWLNLLRAETGKGRSIGEVAAEIGMARPTLSMLLAGKYPAKLDKISRKFAPAVVRRYRGQILCPHLRRGLGAEECRAFAAAPMSTSNPDKLAQWSACRRCPQNPLFPQTAAIAASHSPRPKDRA